MQISVLVKPGAKLLETEKFQQNPEGCGEAAANRLYPIVSHVQPCGPLISAAQGLVSAMNDRSSTPCPDRSVTVAHACGGPLGTTKPRHMFALTVDQKEWCQGPVGRPAVR